MTPADPRRIHIVGGSGSGKTTLGSAYVLLDAYGITGIGIAWLASQGAAALVLTATALRPIVWRRAAS